MDKYDGVYMGTAMLHAGLSHAKRRQVGACLVTDQKVTLTGYNGTPYGKDNSCEDENNVTKIEVVHAELNAVLKAAREGISILNSTLYVTLSPCLMCSAMLIQAGVKRVVYKDEYRDLSGIDYLRSSGIQVEKYNFVGNVK